MSQTGDDELLLDETARAVRQAGEQLMSRFRSAPAPTTLPDLLAGIAANDASVESALRDALLSAHPGSQWATDEEEEGALPEGEWWVADPAEGNVNHLHGRSGWGVTATLVRDGEPLLTAVEVPMAAETYTALAGKGSFVNGQRLRVSAKRSLEAAIVAGGQASPGETSDVRAATLRSAHALLETALVVRLSVPTALELVDVAAGRLDAFWQHGRVRAGLIGGALLVREAGGLVTDLSGNRWTAASADFLASAPAIQPAVLAALSSTAKDHA